MNTDELDAFVAAIRAAAVASLPAGVRRAAERSLLNIIGVTAGAERTEGVQRLARALSGESGVPLGISPQIRGQAQPRDAALLTGFAGHYDDFDDTHLATVIHPSAAGFGVVWALGHESGMTGDAVLRAFAVGAEAQLRLGVAVCPEHYDRGWHITGTCGVIGATVTAALLRGLDDEQLAAAIAIASVRTLGHREAFGTECKPLHAGLAAVVGIDATDAAAALDAGWRHGPDPLGLLLDAFAPGSADHDLLTRPWTGQWELESNTFKPYPCGIVAHPGIDAAIDAANEALERGLDPRDIVAVRYRAHPLVPELMGRTDPKSALEARFSARHGVAAGLRYGRAGIEEFADEVALDPEIGRLRSVVEIVPDSEVGRDEAKLTVEYVGESRIDQHVVHARGSAERPLTDGELRDKAAVLLELVGGPSVDEVELMVLALAGSPDAPWKQLVGGVA